jgi:hypothetical protein
VRRIFSCGNNRPGTTVYLVLVNLNVLSEFIINILMV